MLLLLLLLLLVVVVMVCVESEVEMIDHWQWEWETHQSLTQKLAMATKKRLRKRVMAASETPRHNYPYIDHQCLIQFNNTSIKNLLTTIY
jgi:hypothetical protein